LWISLEGNFAALCSALSAYHRKISKSHTWYQIELFCNLRSLQIRGLLSVDYFAWRYCQESKGTSTILDFKNSSSIQCLVSSSRLDTSELCLASGNTRIDTSKSLVTVEDHPAPHIGTLRVLTMNQPNAHNAISQSLLAALKSEVDAIEGNSHQLDP
jgi:hypothetical protein